MGAISYSNHNRGGISTKMKIRKDKNFKLRDKYRKFKHLTKWSTKKRKQRK
jgi:hypothetical protein